MSTEDLIIKSDGTSEAFNADKLVHSLRRSGATTETIEHVLDAITLKKWSGMSTEKIYTEVYAVLKKREHTAAMKYSVRKGLFELGPDGFPFEKFVARIFNAWGYEAVTGQILMGTCVEHEVDVVAWSAQQDGLSMAEVKFHNDANLKSDLKVALYVKARFDDLAMNVFDYGGKSRKLGKRYLFTNTKFSTSAIKYGTCNDLNMISWNNPDKDNLYNILEKYKIYPITCLTTLSKEQKRELIADNIIVCADLHNNFSRLDRLQFSEIDIKKIKDEVEMII